MNVENKSLINYPKKAIKLSNFIIYSMINSTGLFDLWIDWRKSIMFDGFNWTTFLLYLLIGFFAQIIDGSLGMAYGVSANSFLLSTGVSPAAASASVHIAEVFTTLASGISHIRFKNVDWKIIKSLIIPGVIGGIVGAYILVNFPADVIKPFITLYLLIMGIRIFIKAFNHKPGIEFKKLHYAILGLLGGFFDAAGGGGWGPIVTSTLISNHETPRKVIGSVNIAEFFVTFVEAVTFIAMIVMALWSIVQGLIIGGVIAAPLIIIGSIIVLLQVRAFLSIIGIQIF
jgi:uncharacterized membrane protein YfcA